MTSIIVVIAVLTAGSALLMWIGESITENGVGNGISIVLLINIISGMPSDFATLYNTFVASKTIARGVLAAAIILAILLAVVVLVCFLQDGERRIPVQYSQKITGRRSMGGQSTHIPLKVNTAGVMPIIFASSLMQFPVIIAQLFSSTTHVDTSEDGLKEEIALRSSIFPPDVILSFFPFCCVGSFSGRKGVMQCVL